MEKFDFKKEYKDLYMPKKEPVIIDVPAIKYIMVDGKGDPNTSLEYQNAMSILYGLSFTIKMSKMGDNKIDGYFDYVVPPLEGLWWGEDGYFDGLSITDKSQFCWTSMIRVPDFVTEDVFEWGLNQLKKKKPELDYSSVRFETLTEGLCVQIMHVGSYDNEPDSIMKMKEYIDQEGYVEDFEQGRKHHEIYLGDPRRVDKTKLKTVIRHPVKRR